MSTKIIGLLLSCGVALGVAQSAIASGDHAESHERESMHGQEPADSGIGHPGKPMSRARVIKMTMSDGMRFSPADIRVKAGETVRFVVANTGKLRHEMVLATAAELKEHSEMMKKFPGMEHSEPNMVTVEPGGSGEIVWTFTQTGKVEFGCLQPGHFDAGMKGAVTVSK